MRTSIASFVTLFAFAFVASPLAAQDAPMQSKPAKEHELLKNFTGEWESEGEGLDPSGQTFKCKGSMKSRMLGELWAVNETKGEMMGFTMNGLQTIGFDEKKKKYVGTWVDNCMNLLWKYEGTYDPSTKTIHLEAEGPDFADPNKTTKYRDSYQFQSKDQIIATSEAQGPDGKWVRFMTGKMTRKTGEAKQPK